MEKAIKLGRRAATVIRRIQQKRLTLVRTSSQATDAVEHGGGYLYATYPDGQEVTPSVGKFLIEAGFFTSQRDDLFANVDGGRGQVFALADPLPSWSEPKR